jgi:Tol biopolymer transport system component
VNNQELGNRATSSVWVLPSGGGTPLRITDDQSLNTSPTWLPGRRSLVYVSDQGGGRDLYQVALTRGGRSAAPAVRLTTGLNAAQVIVAADGRRLAYVALTESSNIWSLPILRSGAVGVDHAEPVTRGSQVIETLAISPDGRWLAFDSDRAGVQQIYRVPLAGGEVEQLTSGTGPAFSMTFSPDGREIAYHAFQGSVRQVFVISTDGGPPTQVTSGPIHFWAPRWSPNGSTLLIGKNALTTKQELDLVTRDGAGQWGAPRTLVKGAGLGTWAPDGRAVVAAIGGYGAAPRTVEVVPVGGGKPRVLLTLQDQATDVAPVSPYPFGWPNAETVYFIGRNPKDRSFGIWRIPALGGAPRPVVRFDDPARPWHQSGFAAFGGRFYFTLGDRQSDVWLTEIVDFK